MNYADSSRDEFSVTNAFDHWIPREQNASVIQMMQPLAYFICGYHGVILPIYS